MVKRIFNFSAGPCTLPLSALEKAQAEFVNYADSGMSLIEMSHRGKIYDAVHNQAIDVLRELLAIPESHEILLLGGGGLLMNRRRPWFRRRRGSSFWLRPGG